ncbi:cytochrome ubiquinol oxidase subunit I [Halalkalicoccus jeotgali]|uniref:Cytochrome bd ubiquinol oxidase subunit I n=1 Tax=Halalkalicoccus jeotgali (strain DSM 18796 / CECT 7217 / JCM 14584 / KCTC 4019 / B3) TaxID=795797 RepID=D8JCJ3_HALJB|nr:cytochrome ubiquinol oxidase subunit I [Halalkalicoccus jeotgali]ADJ17100.1 cytochrome bd ubiquinol oxidase subunit I [Halalkalicoccus jeotgali B3]ELY41744.1 cytochrome bd ubiquinol oxidase subunit I [Halalkalicoccus jeotgali B3]
MLDPVLASRIQFALTVIVHIIFPVVSMGLAPFLIYFTWKDIRSDKVIYEQLRRFWTRIFAVSFATGTVTGLVLEFEFGTNFAAFSKTAGELFGGPLALEGMMAFMLEATFLGIFVFGRERVSDRLYFLSSIAVGLGTWLSAVWILIANSWMQTPRGFEVVMEDGQPIVHLVDPIAAYLNPRFPWMFVHMQNAAVESVALLMAGIGAYYVFRHHIWGYPIDNIEFWEATLKIALVVLVITAPLQAIHGDLYARHVVETQPQKFAAMEAIWETDSYVPEYIVAFPTSIQDLLDPRAKEIFGLGIPGGASWLASGGDPQATIQGLNEFEGPQPPVAIVFWSFRIMVALGFWFILLAFWGVYRWWRSELYEDDLLHKALMLSAPLGLLAVELGWIVTEVGRQPWVIQGVMKTSDSVSPGLTGAEATATLVGFAIVYLGLLTLYTYVVVRIIRAGPPDGDELTTAESSSPPQTEVSTDD